MDEHEEDQIRDLLARLPGDPPPDPGVYELARRRTRFLRRRRTAAVVVAVPVTVVGIVAGTVGIFGSEHANTPQPMHAHTASTTIASNTPTRTWSPHPSAQGSGTPTTSVSPTASLLRPECPQRRVAYAVEGPVVTSLVPEHSVSLSICKYGGRPPKLMVRKTGLPPSHITALLRNGYIPPTSGSIYSCRPRGEGAYVLIFRYHDRKPVTIVVDANGCSVVAGNGVNLWLPRDSAPLIHAITATLAK